MPSNCVYGGVTFRCITYSAVNQANARLFTKMLMTGFRDHFVNIRIDWSLARQQNAADAERGAAGLRPGADALRAFRA